MNLCCISPKSYTLQKTNKQKLCSYTVARTPPEPPAHKIKCPENQVLRPLFQRRRFRVMTSSFKTISVAHNGNIPSPIVYGKTETKVVVDDDSGGYLEVKRKHAGVSMHRWPSFRNIVISSSGVTLLHTYSETEYTYYGNWDASLVRVNGRCNWFLVFSFSGCKYGIYDIFIYVYPATIWHRKAYFCGRICY